MTDQAPLSLVADIGGTNTRVALAHGATLLPETVARYPNARYQGLEAVLSAYLATRGNPACNGACVALAGPVRDGVGSMTNLDWTIDTATLARAAQAPRADVINDLQAQGHALGHIAPDHLTPILPGMPAPANAARLVIGIGTGFNCAPVYETPAGRLVTPSEAGHASLPIRSPGELELSRELGAAHGFSAIEDVLSGRGLAHLAGWVGRREGRAAARSAAQVMEAAGAGDADARAALALFVRILGTVTGNLALVHLPFGGVFLVGGVARAVGPWLAELGFAEALHDKGRFADFMQAFPVTLVEDDYAALIGCAHHLDQKRAPGKSVTG